MKRELTWGGRPRRNSLGSGAGFTILELLVAVTIALMLSGLMLAVVTGTLNQWQRTQDGFSISAQAKLALDMVERDLQAAVFRRDGGSWFAVDVINTPTSLTVHGWLASGSIKPATAESQRLVPETTDGTAPAICDARFGLSGAWLRFVTTNVESGGSLPIAVSYQVARRPVSGAITATNPADVRYTLFRAAVSTENTFASGNDVMASAYGSSASNPAASRNPATLANPNTTDALATNVVDFGIWFYERDSSGGLRRIFPLDNNATSYAAHDSSTPPVAPRFPQLADVMVRILTENGAVKLAKIEHGSGHLTRPAGYANDREWWWAVVEENSRVYTRRIEVKGASL